MKLSDYMAAGRPIVTTDVGDLGRTVRDGRFGLVASDTPQDLADKTAVLFSDPEARAAMGGRARAAAESGHSWGALAERLEGHYQTLIELQAKQDDSR